MIGTAILIVFLILQFIYIYALRDSIFKKENTINELNYQKEGLRKKEKRLEFGIRKRLIHNDLLVKRNFDLASENSNFTEVNNAQYLELNILRQNYNEIAKEIFELKTRIEK